MSRYERYFVLVSSNSGSHSFDLLLSSEPPFLFLVAPPVVDVVPRPVSIAKVSVSVRNKCRLIESRTFLWQCFKYANRSLLGKDWELSISFCSICIEPWVGIGLSNNFFCLFVCYILWDLQTQATLITRAGQHGVHPLGGICKSGDTRWCVISSSQGDIHDLEGATRNARWWCLLLSLSQEDHSWSLGVC